METQIFRYISTLGILTGMVFILFLASCNVQVNIDLQKTHISAESLAPNLPQGDIRVRISMPPYLVNYVQDLLGEEGIKGIITVIGLQEYLETKLSISNINISSTSSQVGSEIHVAFSSTNILRTLEEFNIPYIIESQESDKNIVKVRISRNFIEAFLNSFQAITELGIVPLFFPDPKTVSAQEFPEYVAWSLGDYQLPDIVIDEIQNKSHMSFVITENKSSHPTANDWESETLSTQQSQDPTKSIDFVSALYSDSEEISFTY